MNELAVAGILSGSTVVSHIRRDSDEYIWNATDTAFEVYNDTNRDAGEYDVVLAEQGTSEYYTGDMPTDITSAGLYNISFYSRTGASAPYDYEYETAGTITWSGSAEDASPSGLSWITRAQYKTYRNITDTSQDDWIDQVLPQVSVVLNNYLGHTIKQTAHTKVYSGRRGMMGLNLGEYPINSITSVTLDYLGGSPSVIDGGEFYANEVGTIRFKPSSIYDQYFNTPFIKVVFSAGYSSVPQDLQLACMMVMYAFEFMADSEQVLASKTVKDIKIVYSSPVMANLADPIFGNARAILDKYKAGTDLVVI